MALDMDYIDVAARIVDFRAKHPDGSLQPANLDEPFRIVDIAGQQFVVVVAAAYRTPDDPRPGIGMAYEAYPGKTNFTRGSELQNAETSAWGRAIVAALAGDTKRGIASAEEVRNRRADQTPPNWDPVEQEIEFNKWQAEIDEATSMDELAAIGKRMLSSKRSRELSPATYDKLAIAGGARKGELNGAST